jgi:hypothetical protein
MTFTGSILALDLGTRTGFAVGHPDREMPVHGSIPFGSEGASVGAIGSKFAAWLSEWLARWEPRIVVFEAPLPPRAQSSTAVARVLIGLAFEVERVCFDAAIYDVREATVQQIRAYFLGNGRLPSTDAEAATLRRCRQLGWAPGDHNAAAAARRTQLSAAHQPCRHGADAVVAWPRLKTRSRFVAMAAGALHARLPAQQHTDSLAAAVSESVAKSTSLPRCGRDEASDRGITRRKHKTL